MGIITCRLYPYGQDRGNALGEKDWQRGYPRAGYSKEIEVELGGSYCNPKGVYRRSGNNQDFRVHLLELPGELATSFHDFKSDGPWMAEILVSDKNFITLDEKQVVTGSTGSSIEIYLSLQEMKLLCHHKTVPAVVRLHCNSYTCTHLAICAPED